MASATPANPTPLDLKRLRGLRLVVIGDLILDRYVWGSVERISPEAPVPVMREERTTELPGGAANVARNLAAAGARVEMIGVTGRDEDGQRLGALLAEEGIGKSGIVVDPARPTTIKTRILSGTHQLMRLDRERIDAVGPALQTKIVASIRRRIDRAAAVILSDYRKGVIDERVIAETVKLAREAGVAVIVDPKATDFRFYRGADYLTPNLLEASRATGKTLATQKEIEAAGRELTRQYRGRGIAITRGRDGVSLIDKKSATHIPATAREVFDITGAGDTFIAHFALALAAGFTPAQAARIGNAASGVSVSKLGAATVSPDELAAAMGSGDGRTKVRAIDDVRTLIDRLRAQGRRIVLTNGCFDLFHAGHVRLLHEARALGDVLVVALNSDESVRRIKGAPRPILPARERAAVLSALGVVDYIVVFDEDTPEKLLAKLQPDVLVKGREKGRKVIGTGIVERHGGRVVELPLFDASSTKDLVRKIRKRG